jgi:replication fork protection complex subunit Csm3/Swi3
MKSPFRPRNTKAPTNFKKSTQIPWQGPRGRSTFNLFLVRANLIIYSTQFSDVAQLLRTYQLWLDDLYPRAKFADGLAIIEKLGHSKRMQIMRKAWIDESKPKASVEEEDAELESLPLTVNPGSELDINQFPYPNGSLPDSGLPEDDLFYMPRTNGLRPSGSSPLDEIRGAPDDDELDALLAEDSLHDTSKTGNSLERRPKPGLRLSEDEDEEQAMREMREMDDFW